MALILGQQVEYSSADVLNRVEDVTARDQFQRRIYRKVWRPSGVPAHSWMPEPVMKRGVIVGIRTLTNGRNEYYGSDEPITYCPEEHFAAYLVAFDMRRRPVFVLGDNLKEV